MRPRHVAASPALLAMSLALSLAAGLAVVLPAAARPPVSAAPEAVAGAAGSYSTTSGDYAVRGLRIAGFPDPVPVKGHYVAPVGAVGPRPVALFMHGKHTTCYRAADGSEYFRWPCPSGAEPTPSYLGYRYLQRVLASRGYVTVSIMANGIDGQEDVHSTDSGVSARSALVRRHLRLLDSWNTGASGGPDGTDWSGRVDLTRTLLVGHSRGGEGVLRAAVDTAPDAAWRVRGLVLLAPSNNTRQVAPRVPTTVLMGYCDGDLNFWPGQGYLDVARDVVSDPALRSAVSVAGANHAFFNTQWTPGLADTPAGDDAATFYGKNHSLCGPKAATRLSGAEQRAVTKVYVAAAAEVFVDRDPSRLSLFDGRLVRPGQAGGADVQVSPLGGHRVLVRPRFDATLTNTAGASARICAGYAGDAEASSCGRGLMWERAPHWLPSYSTRATPTAPAAEIDWRTRGARAGLALREPADLGSSTHLDARLVVDPEAGPVRLAFRLTDVDGDEVVLHPRLGGRLEPMPGPGRLLRRLWGQTLRAPLSGLDAAGVDRSAIVSVELVSRNRSGRVWLLEASGWRRGIPPLGEIHVPRVDVLNVRAPEGGAGEQVLAVPLRVAGTLTSSAVVSVQIVDELAGTAPPPTRLLLHPGQRSAVIPITYQGDGKAEPDGRYIVNIWARSGVVAGRQQAAAVLVDDD